MSKDEPIEWTAEEAELFDGLPRELSPDPAVEARTFEALRSRGLLGNRRRRSVAPGFAIAAAAAAFILGLVIGRQSRPAGTGGPSMAAEPDSSGATVTWIVGM